MTRIFLGDDQSAARGGLRAQLAGAADLLVVGEASGTQALGHLRTTPADVLLLGVARLVPEALATTQRLRSEFPQVKVIVLCAPGPAHQVSQFLAAGACGYLLNNIAREELLVAIRAVAAGRQFLGSGQGLVLLQRLLARHDPAAPLLEAPKPLPLQLTRRENEILRLLAEGLTTSEMAQKLAASKRTVETHRQNMLEKTKTRNTTALIRLAMAQGLLS